MAFGGILYSSSTIDTKAGGAIGVYYTYHAVDPNIDYKTVSYQYGDGTTPDEQVLLGRSASVQKITNNFPRWMALRQFHDSNAQKLITAWAHHLEDAYELYAENRADQFLTTADQYNDIYTGISELSFNEVRVYEPVFRNFLYNSSFSFKGPTRYQKPEGWRVTRSNVDALSFDSQSLWGNSSIRLDPQYGGIVMKQQRLLNIGGGTLNASIYVKSLIAADAIGEDATSGKRHDADVAGMILVLKYADSTVASFGLGFPINTKKDWVRASFSVSILKQLNSFEFIIVNRSTSEYVIDLPQVETGPQATSWTTSVNDVPPYSIGTTRDVTGVQVLINAEDGERVNKIELLPVASEEEFKQIRIPTRIVPYFPKTSVAPTINNNLGRQINYFAETMPTTWIVSNEQILEKSAVSPDTFGSVLPADLYVDEHGDKYIDKTAIDDSQIVIKAVCVYNGWIYIVSQETYLNKTKYYLKFARPYKVNYEDSFIQSYKDLEIDLPLGGASFGLGSLSEDINRIGICKDIPNVIFIDTNRDRRFYFEFKYDYFYADLSRRRLFTRQNYVANNGHLQVI
jgi:hypothetical protein